MSAHEGSRAHTPLVRAGHPWGDPLLARLYDAFPFDEDIEFYSRLAAAQGGRVLEVACGTGRVLVPLERAGNRVVGLDSSPHMLAIARAKLKAGGAHARLIQTDMMSFDLGETFDLAIVATKSFCYVLERAQQQAALAAIRSHLRPGGLLAVDLVNPTPGWLSQPAGSLRQDLVEETLDGVVMRTEAVVVTDLAAQIRMIRSTYDVVDDDGRVSRRVVEWPYRYVYRHEAELLLESAGLTVEAVYGGYHGEPFESTSTMMMFVARAPSG